MASKKIKLTMEEAGVILDYHGALHKESALVLNSSRKLIETFGLYDNNEVEKLYEENLYKFGEISTINPCRGIFDSLVDIFYAKKNKLSQNELLKLKEFYEDYLKTFESNTMNYFNELNSLKKDNFELVNSEIQARESIKNIRFLTNRIIKLIDSKI